MFQVSWLSVWGTGPVAFASLSFADDSPAGGVLVVPAAWYFEGPGQWYGVLAPRGTPPAVVARLNQEIRAALSTDDARASFATQGMQPAFSTPEEFGRLIERDQARWAQVVARAKISAD